MKKVNVKKFEDFLNEELNVEYSEYTHETIVGKLFQSRDLSHLYHLRTSSNEFHLAVGEYYDGIIGLIDTYVESYQGLFGKMCIEIPGSKCDIERGDDEFILYIEGVKTSIDEYYKTVEDPLLASILEQILEVIVKVIYKLNNLF